MPGTVSEVSATLVASTTRRPACGRKTRCCSALDSRAYSGSTSMSGAQAPAQRLGGVADLALAAQEHEHVPRALAQQLLDRVADRVDLVGVLVGERPVAHLDRVRAAGDLDDRRAAEVRAKRCGSIVAEVMISFRSGRRGRMPLQVAEQEVDVEAALVRLVDDDRVVAAQQAVAPDLGEQQAVGHQPDQRVRRERSLKRTA